MPAITPPPDQPSTEAPRQRGWSTIDYFIRCRPDEYCDLTPPGEAMSDRAFMYRQAARIIRSPSLSREQRAPIERVWLAAEPALRALA